ncbi:MAG: hypothetical protein K8T10_03015 [Candidatus Eremiobacteraeota bacterium]|nr:hypothetical protein [Candidatus Eremiobacteraeota bacterium]
MTKIIKSTIVDISKLRNAIDSKELLFLLRKNVDSELLKSIDIFLYSEDLNSFYFPPNTFGKPDEEFRMKFMEFTNMPHNIPNKEGVHRQSSEELSLGIDKRRFDMIPEKFKDVFTGFTTYLEEKEYNSIFIPLSFKNQFLGFLLIILNDEYRSNYLMQLIDFLTNTCEDILYLQMKEWQIERYMLECQNAQKSLMKSENIKLIGEMTGGITHEFNNIFTGIMGFSQLIQMTSFDKDVRESIDEILKVAREGKAEIDFLQKTKRIDPEETPLPVNVFQLVRDSANSMRHLILSLFPDKSPDDIFQIEFQELRPVSFPKTHLKQFFSMIFAGLLKKKIDLIKIKGKREDEGFIIEMEYSRISQAESKLPVNSKTSSDFPESLILHNLSSRLGFNLILKPGKIRLIFRHDKNKDYDIVKLQGNKVLLFERNPSVLRMFHMFFNTFGIDAKEIETLPDLEEVMKNRISDYDCLLLDVSAYPVIEKLSLPDDHPPIILTSAWGEYLDIKSIDEKKINRILPKPFNFENILEVFN